jgi:hypothetical protein
MLALVAAGAVFAAGAAQAQDACRYWPQQQQAANTQLMQQIAGVWQSEERNAQGGVVSVTTQYGPDGSIQSDSRTCYSMEAQGLGTSCPTTSAFGMWVAHYNQDGSFFVATNVRSSLSNGQNMQGCGGYQGRFADATTIVDMNGQLIARRVR